MRVPKPRTIIILIALLLFTALSFITYQFDGGTQEKVYDEAEAPGGAQVKRAMRSKRSCRSKPGIGIFAACVHRSQT